MVFEMLGDKKTFTYQIIPADEADPITRGAIDMGDDISEPEFRMLVEPLLGSCTMMRRIESKLFVDADAERKGLPHNSRATAIHHDWIVRQCPAEKDPGDFPVAGAAIVFDEPMDWIEPVDALRHCVFNFAGAPADGIGVQLDVIKLRELMIEEAKERLPNLLERPEMFFDGLGSVGIHREFITVAAR